MLYYIHRIRKTYFVTRRLTRYDLFTFELYTYRLHPCRNLYIGYQTSKMQCKPNNKKICIPRFAVLC